METIEESRTPFMDRYERRSLTREESSRLKVPQRDLQCSVMHFTKKRGGGGGYVAYTHRARSKFYDRPEDIPAKTLEFISSTS
jgi:hypothetical protein